ncbi:MAG: efflux transporter outer membrane subunit [Gammaproteobacteria bacterium]|nr:efflux transporter outer membrane subunit [Gammaproteobacteria bacterium]
MTGARVVSRLLAIVTAAVTVTLSGCAVGPDFKRPPAPPVDRYTRQPLPAATASTAIAGGAAQRFAPGADIPGQWWALYHSAPLNALIDDALRANPSLQAAQAALRQAREVYLASVGNLFPSFDGNFRATRQKTSGSLFAAPGSNGVIFSLYNVQAQVSYTVDLFGGVRRQIEENRATVDFQRFQFEASYLTLTSNVVTAAVRAAAVQAQIEAAEEVVAARRRILDSVQRQLEAGGASQAEVQQQLAQLAQAQAALPPLRTQKAQLEHQLAALTGRFPSQMSPLQLTLDQLTLPQQLPLSLPSKLVEQRPDVRAAEAQLHRASAAVGVATANLLPQFTITGFLGSVATHFGDLLSPGGGIWNLSGGVLIPFFHGGTLLHQKRAAVAAFEQAAAQYRSTVLNAFQNVADALRALTDDADALQAQHDAERAAKRSQDIAEQQYAAGAISYPVLLQAELTYQQTRSALALAQGARFADTAALFQALGGGWWNRGDGDLAETAAPAAASSTR